jgi:hypothetical protein
MASKSRYQSAASKGNGKPGNSDGAMQRRLKNSPGTIYSGRPGDELTLSRRAQYRIAADGSFRRIN